MLHIRWDQEGIVYHELLKPGGIITAVRYKQLNQGLKTKRPEYAKRHEKLILLHDNTRPHVAKFVKKNIYLQELGSLTSLAIFTGHSARMIVITAFQVLCR